MEHLAWKTASLLLLIIAIGCSENDPKAKEELIYTGNEVTYSLQSASEFNISGVAVFKERLDHSTDIVISLDKTFEGDALFPVHLHFGDVSTDQADLASSLTPIDAKNGKSVTLLKKLADESLVEFEDLKKMNACIKIHLAATGEDKNIILSAGNIGSALASKSNGRLGIAVCKSE